MSSNSHSKSSWDSDEYESSPSHHKNSKYGHGQTDSSGLSSGASFVIWLVILIILIWILRSAGIRWFSAVVFSLVVSVILLTIFFPLDFHDGKYHRKNEDSFFALIHLITWILVVVYIIWKVFTDRDDPNYSHNGGMMGDNASAKVSMEPQGPF